MGGVRAYFMLRLFRKTLKSCQGQLVWTMDTCYSHMSPYQRKWSQTFSPYTLAVFLLSSYFFCVFFDLFLLKSASSASVSLTPFFLPSGVA